jgi:urease accessory protein
VNRFESLFARAVDRRRDLALLILALAVAAFRVPAFAHTDQAAGGFLAGLLHPILGVDHFLAMLSVGIVSAQLGGRRIFTVPTTFVAAMVLGALAGIYGNEWPFAEVGIALSVVVLGLAIATAHEGRHALAILAVVAVFGSLHGHAHGLEMPGAADPVYYGGGFLLSTATIHLLGVGVGHWFTLREDRMRPLRHLGTLMAGMGLMIFLNLVTAQ